MTFLVHLRRNVVAYLALVIALGGTSYAATALPRDSVGAKQVKTGAVRAAEVKDGSLQAADFAAGQLPAGAQGPVGAAGPKGDKGEKGDVGPATGAAGGDLTGTYPDPEIAVGAVGVRELSAVPTVRVWRTTNLTVGANGGGPLGMDAESYDASAMHSPGNNVLTAPSSGVYQVNAGVFWEFANPAGTRNLTINTTGPAARLLATVSNLQNSTDQLAQSVSTQVRLAAGESVAVVVSNNGSAPAVIRGAATDELTNATMALVSR